MLPFEKVVTDGKNTMPFPCDIRATQNILVLLKKNARDDGREANGKLHCIRLGMFCQMIKNKFSKIKGRVCTYVVDQASQLCLDARPMRRGSPVRNLDAIEN